MKGNSVTFTESIRTCFKKYTDFKGRASRSEFWWWTLFTTVTSIVLNSINENLFGAFGLVVIVPSLAVGARRLHDTNYSGWLQLLLLIPIVGDIVLIIWWAQAPKEPNKYDNL